MIVLNVNNNSVIVIGDTGRIKLKNDRSLGNKNRIECLMLG